MSYLETPGEEFAREWVLNNELFQIQTKDDYEIDPTKQTQIVKIFRDSLSSGYQDIKKSDLKNRLKAIGLQERICDASVENFVSSFNKFINPKAWSDFFDATKEMHRKLLEKSVSPSTSPKPFINIMRIEDGKYVSDLLFDAQMMFSQTRVYYIGSPFYEKLSELLNFAASGFYRDNEPVPTLRSFLDYLESIFKENLIPKDSTLHLFFRNLIKVYIELQSKQDILIENFRKNKAQESTQQFITQFSSGIFSPISAQFDEDKLRKIIYDTAFQLSTDQTIAEKRVTLDKYQKEIQEVFSAVDKAAVSKLMDFMECFFIKDKEFFPKAIFKLFHAEIEKDKTPLARGSDEPIFYVKNIGDDSIYPGPYRNLGLEAEGLRFMDFLNRALNREFDPKKTISFQDFIKLVIEKSYFIEPFDFIQKAISGYIKLQEIRPRLLAEHQELTSTIQKARENENVALLEKFAGEIQKEKENPFIKKKRVISFSDLSTIEWGKYVKALNDAIKYSATSKEYKEILSAFIKTPLENAANGLENKSALEQLIIGIKKLPIQPSIQPDEFLKIEKNITEKLIEAYSLIKKDQNIIQELKVRYSSFQSLQQRWVTVLSKISPPKTDEETSPHWLRVKNYIQRYFARISPPSAQVAEKAMVGSAYHQPSEIYFRFDVDNPAMLAALEAEIRLLDLQDKISRSQIVLLNSIQFERTLMNNYIYFDVSTMTEEEIRSNTNRVLDAIHIGGTDSEIEEQSFLFGFKIKPITTDSPKKIGDELYNKSEYIRNIILQEIDKRPEENIKNYYKKINLVGFVDKAQPIMFIPDISHKVAFSSSIRAGRIKLGKMISNQGGTPTMYKIMEHVSTHTPFAKIRSSGIGATAIEPNPIFLSVDSFEALCEHDVFKAFKEKSKSQEAIDAGVDFTMQNIVKLVEKFNPDELRVNFSTAQSQTLLKESFALILTALQEGLSYTLGLLRDIVDMARIKEHVIEQVFMWLDHPLPEPKNEEGLINHRKILVEKQKRLELAMSKAQFGSLAPAFCQFVPGGGMDAFNTILQGYVELTQSKPFVVGEMDNSYFENKDVIKLIQGNKIQHAFVVKQDDYPASLHKMIENIKANREELAEKKDLLEKALEALKADEKNPRLKKAVSDAKFDYEKALKNPQKLDLLFVDPHPSPKKDLNIIKKNNIPEIIKIIMESGVASDTFSIVMDTTTSPLHSKHINKIIAKNLALYPNLNIITYRSCHKFDSWGDDKLSGGFLAVFSKNSKIVEPYEKNKKDRAIDQFNVDAFTYLFENFAEDLDLYRRLIFNNTHYFYSKINPDSILDPTKKQRCFVDKCEDPQAYFSCVNIDFGIDSFMMDFHSNLQDVGIATLFRFGFGYEITNYDYIGSFKIRIKPGLGNRLLMDKQAEVLNELIKKNR